MKDICLDKLTDIEIPETFEKTKRVDPEKLGFIRKQKGTHIHHIIPLHLGGTNDLDNLIELTIEQHAEAHRLLFEKYGYVEDEIAWKLMVGKVSIEDENIRIKLSKEGIKRFRSNPENIKRWKENIRKNTIGKPKNHKCKDWYIQHGYNNAAAMAEGRRNSKIWREAVTNDEYRKLKRDQMLGREITWGDSISEAKKGKTLYNSYPIEVDGVMYNSVTAFADDIGFHRNSVYRFIKRHNIEAIEGCYYVNMTKQSIIDEMRNNSNVKLPYLIDENIFSSLSKVSKYLGVSVDMVKTFKREIIDGHIHLDIDYDRIERAKKRKNYNK